MTDIIDYIRKINNDYTVDSYNEHMLNDTTTFLNDNFANNIDFRIAIVNNKKQDLLIIDDVKNPHTKMFKARPHEKITVGDLVYIDNTYYLITESNANNDKIQSANGVECNWILKWICPITKTIQEIPCYIQNATKYNTGKYEAKYIDYGISQITVDIPCNDYTIYIDTDMRFFLDKNTINPSIYEATQIDHYTYNYQGKGICRINMSEDKYNPDKDNIELQLADYWIDKKNNISVFDKINNNTNNDIVVKYNGLAEIKIGFSKKFEVITDKNIRFKIYTVNNLYQDLINTSVNNKVITISIDNSFDINLIPYPFVLQVFDDNNILLKELTINIIGLM